MSVPILDPLIGLLITVAILFIVRDVAIAVFSRTLDGIEPSILAQIEHAATHGPGVYDVHEARARWLWHKVHADLHITVDPELTVTESHALVDRVQEAPAALIPALGRAVVHVCPGPERASQPVTVETIA